ncbi:MAG: DNA alkylation repair protein [Leptospirales bacterium]
MSQTAEQVKTDLRAYSNAKNAANLQRFFKTAKGDYGEGDKFLGIKVPEIRKVAAKFIDLTFKHLETLLTSSFHEERFLALAILTKKFARANSAVPETETKEQIYEFYMAHTDNINNWDLVDVSAPQIVGGYLYPLGSRFWSVLYKMAEEDHLWRKRISIISTFTFIRQGVFKPTLDIAKILLNDEHDLIHKAVGWMLREVANRDRPPVEKFLQEHCKTMPRTMLRYAIEKFPEELRQEYLKKICK